MGQLLVLQTRILDATLHDLFTSWYPAVPANDVQPTPLCRNLNCPTVSVALIGGSRASQGESQRFLADMETLVAVVDGRPYQPRTRDKDALAELDDLDDILDRVFSKLCVEFGSKTDNLDELDNPINHVAWMKNCNAGCKVTIEELRQRFDRHPEESW